MALNKKKILNSAMFEAFVEPFEQYSVTFIKYTCTYTYTEKKSS